MSETYKDPEPYCKLGNKREPHQPDGVWELDVSDFMTGIDPKQYFITSGEAVRKAEKLQEDIWELAGKARKFYNLLKKARDTAVYLETEWIDGGRLLIKRKWPRNQMPKKNQKGIKANTNGA